MDSAVRTEDPSIWIEKTEIGGRDYKQEGPLGLGQAVYSPSRDQGGRRAYEAMRKAAVGDIVLHLLQDRQQIVGISTIESELEMISKVFQSLTGPTNNAKRGGAIDAG